MAIVEETMGLDRLPVKIDLILLNLLR